MKTALHYFLLFTLLIPTLGDAAPQGIDPDKDLNATPIDSSVDPARQEEMHSLTVTPPPPFKVERKFSVGENYFYPYQSSISPRFGFYFDSQALTSLQYIFGFNYLVESINGRHWEFGADLYSNGSGSLNGGYRWIFNSNGKFRPYVKGGGSLLMIPSDGLGNFISLSHFRVMAAAGFEDIIRDPMSVRFDLELLAGTKGTAVNILLGYSWAW